MVAVVWSLDENGRQESEEVDSRGPPPGILRQGVFSALIEYSGRRLEGQEEVLNGREKRRHLVTISPKRNDKKGRTK